MVIDPNNFPYSMREGICPNPACRGKISETRVFPTGKYRAPQIIECTRCRFWWQPERGTRRLFSWNPMNTFVDIQDI